MAKTLILMAALLAFAGGGFAQSTTQLPTEARLLTKPPPEYPDDALVKNVAGEVAVEVEVDTKGVVKKARALSGPKPLHKAAVKAARQARFEPASVDGRAMRSRASLVYTFDLGGPTCPAEGERYGNTSELTTKAVILYKPEPGFSERARKNDVTGIVRLRALLCHTGEVTNISVMRGLRDGLTEKAILAAHRIKFRPATKDGRAASQWVTLEYNFNIY